MAFRPWVASLDMRWDGQRERYIRTDGQGDHRAALTDKSKATEYGRCQSRWRPPVSIDVYIVVLHFGSIFSKWLYSGFLYRCMKFKHELSKQNRTTITRPQTMTKDSLLRASPVNPLRPHWTVVAFITSHCAVAPDVTCRVSLLGTGRSNCTQMISQH